MTLIHTGKMKEKKPFTVDDLPSPSTSRWVIKRKAAVVQAIDEGILSEDDACELYSLSPEELQTWKVQLDKNGVKGLRATRVQQYRLYG